MTDRIRTANQVLGEFCGIFALTGIYGLALLNTSVHPLIALGIIALTLSLMIAGVSRWGTGHINSFVTVGAMIVNRVDRVPGLLVIFAQSLAPPLAVVLLNRASDLFGWNMTILVITTSLDYKAIFAIEAFGEFLLVTMVAWFLWKPVAGTINPGAFSVGGIIFAYAGALSSVASVMLNPAFLIASATLSPIDTLKVAPAYLGGQLLGAVFAAILWGRQPKR